MMGLKKAVFRAMAGAGLPTMWRTFQPRGVTILTYHGFTARPSFEGVIDHQRMRLHVNAFRAHVEHLVRHYRVLALSDLVSLQREGRSAPEHTVVVTFDDGYRSCYTLAHPVLKEFGVPATLFVATDFVFEKRPLWHDRVEYAVHATRATVLDLDVGGAIARYPCGTVADKLASLRVLYRHLKRVDQSLRDAAIDELERRAGAKLELSSDCPDVYLPVEISELEDMVSQGLVDVGSHTQTHAILSRCGGDRLRREVVQSKEVIQRALARRCDLFCYPNGTKEDFDERSRAILVESGFLCALTTVPGKNGADFDPMELRRIGAPADQAEFNIAVSGLRTGLGRAYGAVKRLRGVSSRSAHGT
jgi:peptidoglycan/xylan/chitin deacetylase (PgdA/CDA1 family)